jgi:sortase A
MRRTALVLITALVVGAGAGVTAYARLIPTSNAAPAAAPAPTVAPRKVRELAHATVERRPAVKAGPARISIPRLHLKSRVFPAKELNLGPAWWPITGRPGGGDTVAIAGHRTTHTHPFYYLEELRPGDVVYVTYQGKARRYRVTDSRVEPATNLHIGDAVGYERLLLTACTPRGSAAFRLVVEARPS